MNSNIISNYSKLSSRAFILPVIVLITIVLLLYGQHALTVDGYILIQRDCFFFINHHLGQYPGLQYNLTQFGDGLVFLSLLSISLLYVPKIWEALIPGLLVSLLFSGSLKKIFGIPRPAVVFNNDSFIIIGKRLTGFKSLPSGHSITVFTILTILLFAFMPQKLKYKIIWSFFVVVTGLILAFTRVGVGAHYPLDVISGSAIGYISGVSGIIISRKYKCSNWAGNKKYYPFFIVLFLAGCVLLISRIIRENLVIFYLALISLLISLYIMINTYTKR